MMGFPASYDKDSLGNNPSTDEMIFSAIYDDVPFLSGKQPMLA
jgi:hypothetical protein